MLMIQGFKDSAYWMRRLTRTVQAAIRSRRGEEAYSPEARRADVASIWSGLHEAHSFFRQKKTAEMECLNTKCSCSAVSSTTEYLSKDRTVPETLIPLSRYTVTCLPPWRAAPKNDS